jgi:hypothetical protein
MKLIETMLIPLFAIIALASPALAQTDLTPVANQVGQPPLSGPG